MLQASPHARTIIIHIARCDADSVPQLQCSDRGDDAALPFGAREFTSSEIRAKLSSCK